GLHLFASENTRPHQSHLQWHRRWFFCRARRRYCWRHPAMSDDRTFQDAKRLYLEQYGDPMVTNTYLKIALTLVSVIAVGLSILDLKTIRTFENFRPLVIRIDDLGRAEVVNADHQRAEILKGSDCFQIQNRKTHSNYGNKRESNFEICVRHHGVTVLFEVEPLGILEGAVVAHGRMPPAIPPTSPAEEPPAVPLKM